ncbi:MAG: electron transfer flavoprotein subunit beta/FixA family protein [Bacteroidales bacterium]
MTKFNIVVLAKQVPDTKNLGPNAMTAEGTVNRAALPAIFNPEDLNALEQALRIKDKFPGTKVVLLTMGLPKASAVLREGLYRGADDGYLLTDRVLGGADTLATSYALAQAIKKLGKVDIILGGRQAIDGDTAQVGPQIATKLGLPQITYAEKILDLDAKHIKVKRLIDGGVETVESPLPIVVTVNGSAASCRPRNAKLLMKNKRTEFHVWSAADVDANVEQCGFTGSPTKVKAVQNIVFKAKESKTFSDSDEDIDVLMKELLDNHTIG